MPYHARAENGARSLAVSERILRAARAMAATRLRCAMPSSIAHRSAGYAATDPIDHMNTPDHRFSVAPMMDWTENAVLSVNYRVLGANRVHAVP